MKEFIAKHKTDLIIIGAVIIISILSFLLLNLTRTEGKYAEVEINGKITAVYSLDKDGSYLLGDGGNTLVIKDGYAYLEYADCPDKTCVKMGKIRYTGESIICLPNKTTVTVRSSLPPDVDFVS